MKVFNMENAGPFNYVITPTSSLPGGTCSSKLHSAPSTDIWKGP